MVCGAVIRVVICENHMTKHTDEKPFISPQRHVLMGADGVFFIVVLDVKHVEKTSDMT